MALNIGGWEQQLFAKAYEALEHHAEHLLPTISVEEQQLRAAYAHCSAMTAEHSRTFYVASGLLPRDQRQAVRALYAFCRVSDDLVDEGGGASGLQLAEWRRLSLSEQPAAEQPVALAWADARGKYRIPWRYAEQLLDGVEHDLSVNRYETFADLSRYCYGVASTVGLMAMHVVGYRDSRVVPYAVKLGVALQLTNILRDVAEDWQKGRLYLPLAELAAFNLGEADVAAGRVDRRWQAFMHFQVQRTRQLYAQALPGITLLGSQGRFAIAAAAELYRGILEDIEAHDYDVFARRAHTTGLGKVRRLPGIWWRARREGYGSPLR